MIELTEEPKDSARALKPVEEAEKPSYWADKDKDSELMKMSEPNRLTRLMVDRACCCISSAVVLLIVISGLVAALGWLTPSDPNNRDYLVWGDKYVTNFDKSMLAMRELRVSSTDEKVALQSQNIGEWAIILVYTAPADATNLWTKESLTALRDYEAKIKAMDGFKKTCLAREVVGGAKDEVECEEMSFQTAMDLFDDPSKIDSMTQAELDTVLLNALSSDDEWMFDKFVSPENLTVSFMRSIFVGAGPINDGSKRYTNTKEDRKE